MQTLDKQALLLRASRFLSDEPMPFLRWAGSKRRLLTQIVPHLPTSFGRYYEPFLGGGALFFLLQPEKALLSDANGALISVWKNVAANPEGVYAAATRIPLTEKNYYELRASQSVDPVSRAGEFIYMNRGAFNGLYRVNRSGTFNVPWGAPRTANVVDLSVLTSAADALHSKVTLKELDFAEAIGRARFGDLIYLDPPYVTGHNDNGFVDYNERLFSWKDQVRLAEAAERARLRGVRVLVSNAFHAEVTKLYPNFAIHELERKSNIAGNKIHRGIAKEALFVG